MSNNSSVDRINRVAKQLNLPAVTFACKPFVFTMRRILNDHAIDESQVALIGDQLMTDMLLANTLNMVSVFVDPIDVSNLSFIKMCQYKFQHWMMRSFYTN